MRARQQEFEVYPFLQVLLFGLILFCECPLIVEQFVCFLTELINAVHQQPQVLLQK
jgi:hypothetical protein